MQNSATAAPIVSVQANTSEVVAALRGRLAGMQDEASQLQVERADLSRALKDAQGPNKAQFVARLQTTNSRLDRLRSEIAATNDQLRSLQTTDQIHVLGEYLGPATAPQIVVPDHDEHVLGYTITEFTMVGGFLLLLPLVLAVAWRTIRQGRPAAPVRAALEDDRLTRLEQTMEAVAVEIERIGEAQRFQTKLMSEGRQPERRKTPVPVITPH